MKNFAIILLLAAPSLSIAQNVGVGTPNPLNKLHVVSNDTAGVKIENSTPLNTGVSNGLYFKTGTWITGAIKQTGTSNNASRTGIFGYAGQSQADLREYISITDLGNVGINNTAPAEKLSVNGNTSIAGTVAATGNITTAGAVFVGNTAATTNGGLRYNSTANKMEYSENNTWKGMTKPFFQSPTVYFSSATRNTLIIHPSFEFIVPETGYYFLLVKADTYPVLKTSCSILYLDNAASVQVYSKTRAISLVTGAGNFKWHLTAINSCTGGVNIPLMPTQTSMVYLLKDEVITLAAQMDMYNVPGGTLDGWSANGSVTYIKMD
jgi:hypothetical protein